MTWLLGLLKEVRVTKKNKGRILSSLLDNVHAVQISEVIRFDEQGGIHLDGKLLSKEEHIAFLTSVESLSNSFALKYIRNQIARECVKIGVYQAMNEDQILFAKAALWYQQEENKLLQTIINR